MLKWNKKPRGERAVGRIIGVLMYCRKASGSYKYYFEEKEPGEWYGTKTEKVAPLSPFEKNRLRNEALNPKKSGGILSLFRQSKPSGEDAAMPTSGNFYYGESGCPYCGNLSYVKCGTCNKLSCWNPEVKRFTCAICDASGEVNGTIDSLDGVDADGGRKNSSTSSLGRNFKR